MFNPTFGPREEQEHLKLLFFWPPHTPIKTQNSDVGLSEALIAFSKCDENFFFFLSFNFFFFLFFERTFSDSPAEVVKTVKHVYALYQPEPNYWFVLVSQITNSCNLVDFFSHFVSQDRRKRSDAKRSRSKAGTQTQNRFQMLQFVDLVFLFFSLRLNMTKLARSKARCLRWFVRLMRRFIFSTVAWRLSLRNAIPTYFANV